jgi:dTDP-glucose 4,6-dehydratase
VYHLAGEEERTNLEVVRTVLGELDAPADAVVRVRDRPGHDQRYALETDGTARDLEWSPGTPLRAGLRRTVAWYREHRGWWEDVPDLGRRRG